MRAFRAWLLILPLLGATACSRKVASIDVSPKKIRIYGIGSTQRLTARMLDKKGQPIDQGTITWSSSKDDVASVDGAGRVTAKVEGKALITAKFEKVSSQLPVEITDVKTIEVVPPSLQLVGPLGTQLRLQTVAKSSKGKPVDVALQWSSSKPNVATVDPKGVVTSLAPGTATIIAKLGDLQSGCDVAVVLRDLARIELRPTTAILRPGEAQKFEVVGVGTDGKSIEGLAAFLESSDQAVAKVDPSGVATGVSPGTSTIRATLGSLTAEATLLVN